MSWGSLDSFITILMVMNKSRRVLGTWEQGRSERSTPKSQNTGEGKG